MPKFHCSLSEYELSLPWMRYCRSKSGSAFWTSSANFSLIWSVDKENSSICDSFGGETKKRTNWYPRKNLDSVLTGPGVLLSRGIKSLYCAFIVPKILLSYCQLSHAIALRNGLSAQMKIQWFKHAVQMAIFRPLYIFIKLIEHYVNVRVRAHAFYFEPIIAFIAWCLKLRE